MDSKLILFVAALFSLAAGAKISTLPDPRHKGYYSKDVNWTAVAQRVAEWKPTDKQNLWELGGHFQGDILLDEEERNGIVDTSKRWPAGIIPYVIDPDFSDDDVVVINSAFDAYHENTCIQFRPYVEGDNSYVYIQDDKSGCSSHVGRKDGGQTLNLHRPSCVTHGHIVHELLHTIGFHHQQCSSDRDDYVLIHYENIEDGEEHNFVKYTISEVTSFGVPYDYNSVSHYSAYAFSKNGEETITPLQDGVSIGQRVGLSESDILKVNLMYNCSQYIKDF